jgi:hypothetical protein
MTHPGKVSGGEEATARTPPVADSRGLNAIDYPASRTFGGGEIDVSTRLATILPDLPLAEALDTTRIHRVAGLTGRRPAVVTTRPFRSPHQSMADVGLIGGGQIPMPGEVSLTHHGVLFLDELPEFRRHVLEVLRQPLEEGLTRIQSPAHPGSQCCCRLRSPGHGCEGLGHSTIAACHQRDGHTQEKLNQSTRDWDTQAAALACSSAEMFSTAAVTAGS